MGPGAIAGSTGAEVCRHGINILARFAGSTAAAATGDGPCRGISRTDNQRACKAVFKMSPSTASKINVLHEKKVLTIDPSDVVQPTKTRAAARTQACACRRSSRAAFIGHGNKQKSAHAATVHACKNGLTQPTYSFAFKVRKHELGFSVFSMASSPSAAGIADKEAK